MSATVLRARTATRSRSLCREHLDCLGAHCLLGCSASKRYVDRGLLVVRRVAVLAASQTDQAPPRKVRDQKRHGSGAQRGNELRSDCFDRLDRGSVLRGVKHAVK